MQTKEGRIEMMPLSAKLVAVAVSPSGGPVILSEGMAVSCGWYDGVQIKPVRIEVNSDYVTLLSEHPGFPNSMPVAEINIKKGTLVKWEV